MAQRSLGWLALLALLGGLAAGAPPEGHPGRADFLTQDNATNKTVNLTVTNQASVPVLLANCAGNRSLAPGANTTLELSGLSGFWVVPAKMNWSCEEGPYDLFYVAFNITGDGMVASVGYGLPLAYAPGHDKAPSGVSGGGTDGNATSGGNATSEGNASGGNASGSQAGATTSGAGAAESSGAGGATAGGAGGNETEGENLTSAIAGVLFTTEGATARCRRGTCEGGQQELDASPKSFSLTIVGAQKSPLSYFWHGGGWGGGHGGGYGGYGGYGGGGGWRRRRWGYGPGRGWGPRWRRGGGLVVEPESVGTHTLGLTAGGWGVPPPPLLPPPPPCNPWCFPACMR